MKEYAGNAATSTVPQVAAPPSVPPPPPSFAETIKKAVAKADPRPVLLVYGEDGATSAETEKKLRTELNPRKEFIEVRSVRRTRRGAVAVETNTKEQLEKLKSSVAAKGFTSSEPKRHSPRIAVYGVPEGLSAEELQDQVFEGNFQGEGESAEKFKTNFKPKFKVGPRGRPTTNWVVEVSPEVRSKLVDSRVFLAWNTCRARDFLEVFRCFRCLRLGHAAKMCPNKEATCKHCGQTGHEVGACPARTQPPRCAMCLAAKKPADHAFSDPACPVLKVAMMREAQRTEYGKK